MEPYSDYVNQLKLSNNFFEFYFFSLGGWSTAVLILQGLKFSGTVPDLWRAAFVCEKKKKKTTFKKNKLVDITFESMSSPTNGMRGAQLSLSTKPTLLANQNFLLL